jgi:hypothetical protein
MRFENIVKEQIKHVLITKFVYNISY